MTPDDLIFDMFILSYKNNLWEISWSYAVFFFFCACERVCVCLQLPMFRISYKMAHNE